jgi:type VI secretion system secreted protein VgrG
MTIAERLSEPFAYELDVVSELDDLGAADVLGRSVTVSVDVGEVPRHFNALAASLSHLGSMGRYSHYRISLRPWLWFLSRASNCRIFQDLSVPEIVKSVFRDHGFADFEERLVDDYEARSYVVQYRETDLDFVRRLLEHEGIHFFFEHTDSSHTLVLCDSADVHVPSPFHESLPLLPLDGRAPSFLPGVTGWQVRHAVETGAVALLDHDYENPSVNLGVAWRERSAQPNAAYEAFDYPGDHRQTASGEKRARKRLEELQVASVRCEASSNARGLQVGATFSLREHPAEAHNREYLVTSLSGTLSSHAQETGGLPSGDVFQCRFSAIDSRREFRPPRVTPKPIVHGAQTATVVGKLGEEIWTDEYGRIKLRFHWDRFGTRDERSSCWVRVAQMWAGVGFGSLFVPRIGQEVVVDFLEGDPDRPIVTGSVYNGDNPPPYELPTHQTRSGIKTRSTAGGTA